jgi:hypothetical protein
MKLDKEQQAVLIMIAMKLPLLKTECTEKHIVKGSEILEWGTIDELEGKPIDPDKDYIYNYPVVIYQDHLKRLEKAWRRKGPDGVSEYLVWIDNLVGKYKAAEEAKLKEVKETTNSNWLKRLLGNKKIKE